MVSPLPDTGHPNVPFGKALAEWVFTTLLFAAAPFGLEAFVLMWLGHDGLTLPMSGTKAALYTMSFTLLGWADFVSATDKHRTPVWKTRIVTAAIFMLIVSGTVGYALLLVSNVLRFPDSQVEPLVRLLVISGGVAIGFSLCCRLYRGAPAVASTLGAKAKTPI